jgi:AAA+ superfamily predicted ATPase
VRKRWPDYVRSFLFYGPPGTGKTMVVRAISYETNSVVFDLSPLNIEGKYTGKKEEEKMVASVMVVAKEY